MAFESIDVLQKALAEDVFHYAKSRKKAAGRALGGLVEIINFHLLRSWGLEQGMAIERKLPEYANGSIVHNVEFTLHPVVGSKVVNVSEIACPLTAIKLLKELGEHDIDKNFVKKSNRLLATNGTIRNACVVYETEKYLKVAYPKFNMNGQLASTNLCTLLQPPFAMFECKRVGVEEGMTKGPQTIEKAKQGAYVAKSVSSLQKVRGANGQRLAFVSKQDGKHEVFDYSYGIKAILEGNDAESLHGFVLSVGIVSNHGNWFTAEDHNKELKVLAQAYDWLLFLTDSGLSQFITELLLEPKAEYKTVREAFIDCYKEGKKTGSFTKISMPMAATVALNKYFESNYKQIEGWFNVISPNESGLPDLREKLKLLVGKNWKEVHNV